MYINPTFLGSAYAEPNANTKKVDKKVIILIILTSPANITITQIYT